MSKVVSTSPLLPTSAMKLRGTSARMSLKFSPVKAPAIMIRESGRTWNCWTGPFVLESKPGSTVPSGFSRATKLRTMLVVPSALVWKRVKKPPTRILPSACTVSATAPALGFG